MFKAIFFDLDGTLLPLDLDSFMQNYFQRLADHFAHLCDPKDFQGYIWHATQAMIKDNRPHASNEQVFMEAFLPLVKHPAEQLLPMFDQFYHSTFDKLAHCATPTPLARQVVKAVIDRGCRVVLATNPLFPKAATKTRMAWANIADLPWELVTTYENSNFCKPNPAYFAEILRKTNLQASEVLLVGNDPVEDLSVSELGMKTYLVTDWLVKRDQSPYQPTGTGTLAEFHQLVENNFHGL